MKLADCPTSVRRVWADRPRQLGQRADSKARRIFEFIRNAGRPVSSRDISDALGLVPKGVACQLLAMERSGRVYRVETVKRPNCRRRQILWSAA